MTTFKRLVKWDGDPVDITIGKVYELDSFGEFCDDAGDDRAVAMGDWENLLNVENSLLTGEAQVDTVNTQHNDEGESSMTPAQRHNLVVGNEYRLAKPDADGAIGDLFTFVEDDGTLLPYFKRKDNNVLCAIEVHKLEPVVKDRPLLQEVESGDGVMAGDVILTTDGRRDIVEVDGGPDEDGEYRAIGGYIGVDEIAHIYRITPPVKPDRELTITVSAHELEALREASDSLIADEIDGLYSIDVRRRWIHVLERLHEAAESDS